MLIANRFEPLDAAAVFPLKARDLETAQTVVLTPVATIDSRLAGIFHPALVTVFAIVEHAGQTLAAAEFVQARALSVVFGGEPCHPRRAAQIVSEIADGVAELHGRGICHGGIAPASVILTAKGKARLLLTAACGGSPTADLDALRALLVGLGGQLTPDVERTDSAAVMAAALRL
jgi:serine/threonine protein kinase